MQPGSVDRPRAGAEPRAASGPGVAGRSALVRWLAGSPGRLILAAEREPVERAVANLFGYYLVQVGAVPGVDLASQCRILHRLVLLMEGDPPPGPGWSAVRGAATSLPLESDSVDVVLMPHVLEFEEEPHEALREAFRILVPEGHLVVCGFNPWSLLGAWSLARRRSGAMPWRGRFLSMDRLEDWLALLGFDLRGRDTVFFRPPLGNERLMRRLEPLERAGRRVAPRLAGAYVMVARKRVTTMTPLRPRWAKAPRLATVGLPRPSARGGPSPGAAARRAGRRAD